MLNIKDAIRQMLRDTRSQKLRTSLTVLGIVWGTVAVTLLGAFGQGLHKQIITNTAGLGDRIAIAWPGLTSVPWEGLGRGRRIRLREEHIEAVRREVPGVVAVASEYSQTLKLHYGLKTIAVDVSGVWPDFGSMRNLVPQAGGRFVNPIDQAEQRRTLFLGDKIAGEIFGKEPAVGKTVLLGVSVQSRDGERPGDPRAAAALRSQGQGSSVGLGHGRRVPVPRRVLPLVPPFSRDRRLLHARRVRHRRLEHHERRRRGAHQGDRHQDGPGRPAELGAPPVAPRDVPHHGHRRRRRLRNLLDGLRDRPEVRSHGVRRGPGDFLLGRPADGARPRRDGAFGRLLPGARRREARSGRRHETVTRKDVSVVAHLFLGSARLQKKRATLTIASIAWGTVTILLLLAFGEGLKRQLSSNERAMGENLAIHWPGETSKVWKGLPEGRPIRPRIDDIAALRERLPRVRSLGRNA